MKRKKKRKNIDKDKLLAECQRWHSWFSGTIELLRGRLERIDGAMYRDDNHPLHDVWDRHSMHSVIDQLNDLACECHNITVIVPTQTEGIPDPLAVCG